MEPELPRIVDEVAGEMGFYLIPYADNDYCQTPEAHEAAFPLYMKIHEDRGVPFADLYR